MRISNWGKFPVIDADVRYLYNLNRVGEYLTEPETIIARGLGRSYGDSSLNAVIISMCRLNRFLSFDVNNGVLKCEAGVRLDDILRLIVPRGWFLQVTPGTKYVTVGGAIASDVHGKNHHKDGSFSNFIEEFEILLADGEIKKCTKSENTDLFTATCGGMGLTGIILTATFSLKKIETSYISQTTFKAKNLDEIFKLFDDHKDCTYSVAWLDSFAKPKSLGKSVLMLGEHAGYSELSSKHKNKPLLNVKNLSFNLPIDLPGFVLNNLSIRSFNFLYYSKAKNNYKSIVHYEPFFYPLDKVNNWNRIYGKKGFIQYQFILPLKYSYDGLKEILTDLRRKKLGSFLAVLKLYGKQDSLMSFPMEGYSVAMDFPVSDRLLIALDELDQIVNKYGGRLYLTKDSRMKKDFFRTSYPNIDQFIRLKQKFDPQNKFQSLQSKRLGIC